MTEVKSKRRASGGSVVRLSAALIVDNPINCTVLRENELSCLAESIKRYGVLSPLFVRYRSEHYEVFSGSHRLAAARIAGLSELPCVIFDISLEEALVLSLSDKLQRRPLSLFDEVRSIKQLTTLFGMSPEEISRKLCVPCSRIAALIPLVNLPEAVLDMLACLEDGEALALAFISMPNEARRRLASRLQSSSLDFAEAEAVFRGGVSSAADDEVQTRKLILKDDRIIMNTLTRAAELLEKGGIYAKVTQTELEDKSIFTVEVPR